MLEASGRTIQPKRPTCWMVPRQELPAAVPDGHGALETALQPTHTGADRLASGRVWRELQRSTVLWLRVLHQVLHQHARAVALCSRNSVERARSGAPAARAGRASSVPRTESGHSALAAGDQRDCDLRVRPPGRSRIEEENHAIRVDRSPLRCAAAPGVVWCRRGEGAMVRATPRARSPRSSP